MPEPTNEKIEYHLYYPTFTLDINIGTCKDGLNPLIKLCSNGDIFIRGVFCENDKEVVEAMREFFGISKFENRALSEINRDE